ncbi:MAG: hypothetical protein K1X53_13220 [Candidatus Sumerlaeaceae bacterium]|nr:hypothetical protein [Candidatus Sumerlaeaceae bacterium]
MVWGNTRSGNFLHWANTRRRQWTTFRFKVRDYFIHNFAKLAKDLARVIAVNSRNQVWALSNVDPILLIPFHPF